MTAAGTGEKVDTVKFVSGDEKLKSYTDALRTASYHLTFPRRHSGESSA